MHRRNRGCGQSKSRALATTGCHRNVWFLFPKSPSSFELQNLLLCFRAVDWRALPSRGDSGSHHYLDDLRKQEPVKPPAEGLHYRMRENREPGQTSREKHDFAEKAGDCGASEGFASMFHHVT